MSSSNENHRQDHGEVIQRPGIRIAWAWMFPILAAVATGWLFWSDWRSNGPQIEVVFESAPGILAGKTPLIFRGVVAGQVKEVKLDTTLEKVILVVQLKAFAAGLAREGTTFWIDQPVVALGQTSGLDALIQGNSLEARMGDGPPTYHFTGVSHQPITPLTSPALTLKLRARSIPSLDRGSPLFYRGIQVGAVEDKELDESGNPYLRVVIEKEFAGTVRKNSRFWPVPATSLRVGPGGLRLDVLGLKAILLGGMEFDVFEPPAEPATDDMEFTLFPDKTAARAVGAPVEISFVDGGGIQAGQTQIRHLGMPVGLVESVELDSSESSVAVTARFEPGFEHLHTAGATFTLVRPRISLDGISGLETLVSGVYIDCVPGPAGGESQTRFAGVVHTDSGEMTVHSENGAIPIRLSARSLPDIGPGAPILYRGLIAGRVQGRGVGAGGQPYLEALIFPKYGPSLAVNARFWQVAATRIQAGPGILNLDIAGLQALVQGALAFDVFGEPGSPAAKGAEFELFASEVAAKAISTPLKITFKNGQGLLAGQTQLRYLGVPVGLVESVRTQNGRVEATVRLNEGYDFLRREGAVFSVVRLKISLNGVTGLETALSGVYIDCAAGATEGALTDRFVGVDVGEAEFVQAASQGLEIVISTPHSNIAADAPVSYRGLEVGKVRRKLLSSDGRSVGLCAVIDPPYDRLVRENSVFWNAGGLRVSVGFLDIKVQSSSLDALARGGIAFATPTNYGSPVRPGHTFELQAGPRREWQRWDPAIPIRQ